MTLEKQHPERPAQRRMAVNWPAAPVTFLLVDPSEPRAVQEWGEGAIDAVVVDLRTAAEQQGMQTALAWAGKVLGAVRSTADVQIWLRIHPADHLAAAGYRDVLKDVQNLVDEADGVVLPEARGVADAEAVLMLLGGGSVTALLPVVPGDVPRAEIERLAEHPAVVRLAASAERRRARLASVSQAHGFAPPVNGLTPEPQDACALMHDAVLARGEGFGGQCVPDAALASDVRALYRDAGQN
ncbi:hypothetical protein [Streptomyces sp. NPDC020681]|uniref:hypothetical protein n=1 Tax=Streptomyces sp. NPDC020681 TaxID=3365083 RepID=UPI0037897EA2